VRSANTGISAIVDPYGGIVAKLGLGEGGVIDGPLPSTIPSATLYARWGDGILSVLLLTFVLGGRVFKHKH